MGKTEIKMTVVFTAVGLLCAIIAICSKTTTAKWIFGILAVAILAFTLYACYDAVKKSKKKPNDLASLFSDALTDASKKASEMGPVIFNRQRPDKADYGRSKTNPICVASLNATETYLNRLCTKDGRKFTHSTYSDIRTPLYDFDDVGEDKYTLYLDGQKYVDLYFVLYIGQTKYPPAGMYFIDDNTDWDKDRDTIKPESTTQVKIINTEKETPVNAKTKIESQEMLPVKKLSQITVAIPDLIKATQNDLMICSNNIACCDISIYACFIIRAQGLQLIGSREKSKPFSDDYISAFRSDLTDKYGKYNSQLDEMFDNRTGLYDRIITKSDDSMKSLLDEFEFILQKDITENKYVPQTETSPLYLTSIFDQVQVRQEVLSLNKFISTVTEKALLGVKEYYISGSIISKKSEEMKPQIQNHIITIEYSGNEYKSDLKSYMDFVPEMFRYAYNDEAYPEYETPIEVTETVHGDKVYQYILEKRFEQAYKNTIKAQGFSDTTINELEIVELSKEKIVVNANITTGSHTYSNPTSVIKDTIQKLHGDEKLLIVSTMRDKFFWQDIQDMCQLYQQSVSDKALTPLSQMNLVNVINGKIMVDINGDIMRSVLPLTEIMVYAASVFNAALHRYIPQMSKEDNENIEKYLISAVTEAIDIDDKKLAKKIKARLYEYNTACENDLMSGYSMHGKFGFDFNKIKNWSENIEVKCALLLCDYIAYIDHVGTAASFNDLTKLMPIVINNNENTITKYSALFDVAHITARGIFMTVRGALNGGRIMKWKQQGLCQHCGRKFDDTPFGKYCSDCEMKKDY